METREAGGDGAIMNTFPGDIARVTLSLPARPRFDLFPVTQMVGKSVAPTPEPAEGTRVVTYDRDMLCLAVRMAGGCAECDERGGHTCDKVKR